MAQQVTTDATLLTIYKTYYTEKEFPNLLFRNSPAFREITKNRIGGRNYNISALYTPGAGVSGDYVIAVANAAAAGRNAEFSIPPGNVFSVFNITQKEILAATNPKGAYIKPLINRMFASTDGARKAMAASMFSQGYGEFGQLTAQVNIGAFSMTLNYDTVIKMSIGTQFYVTSTAVPNSAFMDALLRTVTAIDGQLVTFDVAVGAVAWPAGAWVELAGGRDGTLAPSMPTGIPAWIPYVANRTGGVWTAYIATAFYGVNRSVATQALAGWFYRKAAGETMADAMTQGINLARMGGGVPNMIVLNNFDYASIVNELNQNLNYMQQINTAGAKSAPNEITRGVYKMRYAFSTSYIEYVIEDPYCPQGVSWVLDKDVWEFVALSNTEPLNDGIRDNEPGTASVSTGAEPDTTFKLTIDDYLNIQGNSTSHEGPAAQVSLSFYGNFACHAPGHNAVIVLT